VGACADNDTMGSSLPQISEKKLVNNNGSPSAKILSKREGYILVCYDLQGYNDTGQLLIKPRKQQQQQQQQQSL